MKITQIIAREIFDSRGFPTVECEVVLDNDVVVIASVPAGKSLGGDEARELRDGGPRLQGKGVRKAVEIIENIIAPELIGKEPDVISCDMRLLELDGTPDKSKLGANTILAVSMAVCKAQAGRYELQLYELIARLCGYESVSLPFPMFNIINGGLHADNNLAIQEFMIMPAGTQNFATSLESAATVFHELGRILKKKGKKVLLGDEGGYAADFTDEREALDFIMEAIENTKNEREGDVLLALDVAASTFYDTQKQTYRWHESKWGSQDLVDYYAQLVATYPIYSIEDGIAEHDYDGWQRLMAQLGDSTQLVGDDLFVTNVERIAQGIEHGWANAALIKPNQVGTVTQTLQAIKLCKENGMNLVVSHRSGETEDTFIADLAVGTSAGQIKAGGCARGERVAKYNQLLRIEDLLMRSALELK